MKDHIYVRDVREGSNVKGYYLINYVKIGYSRNTGSRYISMRIGDCSGEIRAIVWSSEIQIGENDVGRMVHIEANAEMFNNQLQLNISEDQFFIVDDKLLPYAHGTLIPVAPENTEKMLGSIKTAINSISDNDYKNICIHLLRTHFKEFSNYPAAKYIHHDYIAGLLMHTKSMLCIAEAVAEEYGDRIDRNLLLTGVLLHDIGKVREFEVNKAGLVSEYTMEGNLIGHSVLGAFDVLEASAKLDIPREKAMLVEHLILSHHGRPEHGAAVLPRCIEAEILCCLDMLDSREGIYEKVLDGAEAGIPIKAFALNNKRVFKHDPAA